MNDAEHNKLIERILVPLILFALRKARKEFPQRWQRFCAELPRICDYRDGDFAKAILIALQKELK